VCKQYKEKVGKEEAEEKKEKKQEGGQSAASLKKRRIVREKNASVTQVKTEIAAHGVSFQEGFSRGVFHRNGGGHIESKAKEEACRATFSIITMRLQWRSYLSNIPRFLGYTHPHFSP